ncbi:DUF2628 domain-containing protein [Hyphomicrobium sp.]|uniref:DUF2628 domain-containing protein n=1 Tax=Hyphomicrobium sp. TaxID=82 RepID=UPI002BC46C3E|nr:DUF2628 domain-containing protein [Hyphomicrobium sp.]HRN89059.1 DUF2628 domain-containing protein [Hyphomicrobium sp.]HRQ27261.1 DUF2628 domain-containing protein [Hyphomicrobium sp.]
MIRIWPFSAPSGSKTFTVYEPEDNAGLPLERAERLVFVADGFSWRALFFGPLYLAVKREWVGLLMYVVAAIALVHGLQTLDTGSQWITWGLILLNVITGFEAANVQRASLARAGWKELGNVGGANAEEAERRFFTAWLPTLSGEPVEVEPLAFAFASAPANPHQESVSRAETLLRRLSSRLTRKSTIGN